MGTDFFRLWSSNSQNQDRPNWHDIIRGHSYSSDVHVFRKRGKSLEPCDPLDLPESQSGGQLQQNKNVGESHWTSVTRRWPCLQTKPWTGPCLTDNNDKRFVYRIGHVRISRIGTMDADSVAVFYFCVSVHNWIW